MALDTILWVLLGAWLITLIFYGIQIILLLRGHRWSDISARRLGHSRSRQLRKLLNNILISTTILAVCWVVAYILSSVS